MMLSKDSFDDTTLILPSVQLTHDKNIRLLVTAILES